MASAANSDVEGYYAPDVPCDLCAQRCRLAGWWAAGVLIASCALHGTRGLVLRRWLLIRRNLPAISGTR